MSRSQFGNKPLDLEKLAEENKKADARTVQGAREQIQILRNHGVSNRGYKLAPPFRRQVYIQSKHTNVQGHPFEG